MPNTVVTASPTGGYSSTPKLVHGNSVIVGQCTVQPLSRAGMWREMPCLTSWRPNGKRLRTSGPERSGKRWGSGDLGDLQNQWPTYWPGRNYRVGSACQHGNK
jgi:hypothetical protein